MIDLSGVPESERDAVAGLWRLLLERPEIEAAPPAVLAQAPLVLGCSQYVREQCQRHPERLAGLVASGELLRAREEAEFAQCLRADLESAQDEAALQRLLRQRRQREMLRIVWRDLGGVAPLRETVSELSALADAALDAALEWHHERLVSRHGQPRGAASGEPQRLVVLGMGKLGGRELNLSSDIDLIFAYPQAGSSDGERPLSNQEFFTRLGQALIRSLDAHTVDGFVFRVDMRLRPYGDSGALVLNFDAMEEYYQDQGRDWERYAMIKARVVAGDRQRGRDLLALLQPFTYRRYLDFSAFEALRSMKELINREVRRRGIGDDVKLGAGGIREIEFIVQSFQLIRGGREPALQRTGLLDTLDVLEAESLLPAAVAQELRVAYLFLRRLEHRLQAWQDRQTQALPADDVGRRRLARAMGHDDWTALAADLEAHRRTVRRHFAALIRSEQPQDRPESVAAPGWQAFWDGLADREAALAQLEAAGFEDAGESWQRLNALRTSRTALALQGTGRERLDRFMPLFLRAQADTGRPSLSLERSLPLVEAVMRRSAYLVLLEENPAALEQLLRLCLASPMLAEELSRHPVLLDELLDSSQLYTLPDRDRLRSELQQQMLRIELDDLEGQMEALRYFRLAQGLRVAACEISETLPLMKVSDYLTFLAEVIVDSVLTICRRRLVTRHGRPRRPDGAAADEEFLVVAYGKMGGLEMSHGSDLDLVFLHDGAASGATDGERPIDALQFFTRLTQRMIHLLTTATSLGRLYEVDVRLRPSGAAGLLVATLESFRRYQLEEAWTWERQALVRARPVAGSAQLAAAFDAVRREVLCQRRDAAQLAADVVAMRERMREHLLRSPPPAGGDFHLKHSPGGIVDIEFMVQYAVLAWSADHPKLADYTDNVRILESLRDSGLFAADAATRLTEAYKAFRSAQHRLVLEQRGDWVPGSDFEDHVEVVRQQWARLFGAPADTVAGGGK